VFLAVVTIISAMSNANLTDDDSESCSGTVAVSIVAAAAEHDELSAEDQLLFLKVRRDAAVDVSSLTFRNRHGFLRFPTRLRTSILSQTYIVVVIIQELKTSCRECKQTKTTLFVAYTLPVGTIAASLFECQSTTIVLHSFRTTKKYIHRMSFR